MAAIRTAAALAVVCWLLASSGVLAGNRAWESKINHSYGNSNKSVQTNELSKRWYINKPNYVYKLWDQGNIKVCFEQRGHMHGGQLKTTEDILRGPLEGARNVWRDFGLEDKDGWFKFQILEDTDKLCRDESRRTEFLLVMYAGEGDVTMATSPGQQTQATSDATFAEKGSRMLLSDSMEVGMGNVVANFVHEMGHAWGMHHEHQNPRWWSNQDDYDGDTKSNPIFDGSQWFCDQLADYQTAVDYVNGPEFSQRSEEWKQKTITNMCKKQDAAKLAKFTGAMNWLPVTGGAEPSDRDTPDWFSIMTYPSDCGGINDGTGRATVMLKPDGSRIDPVFRPSDHDIDGLYRMYGKERPTPPKLLQKSKGSRFKALFKRSNKGAC